MSRRDLALVQGLDHTRARLRRWNGAPRRVVGLWALGSLAVSAALLYLVWAVSHRGVWRRVHALAGPLAIAFVAGATLFSGGRVCVTPA